MSNGPTLALFDLDGTLVSGDSFRLFASLGARGPFQRATFLALAVAAKLHLISNTRYKELLLDAVWRPRNTLAREDLVARQLDAMTHRIVKAALAALLSHRERGDTVVVITASPALYARPFVMSLDPAVAVRASGVEDSGGDLRVANLYGEAKAAEASALIEEIRPESVHVYTDHRHDLPLMRGADEVTLVNPKPRTIAAVEKAGISPEVVSW